LFRYTDGESERILGDIAVCRNPEKVSIATKANPWGGKTLKYESVMSQTTTSLKSLQVPSIDLFYLHAPDHNTPITETLKAVNDLYKDGKFKRFGLSNYAAWEVSEIYYLCKQNNWVLPTVYQGMYNGVCRMVEDELFPCLRNFGMSFYAYNPLAGGILTGKFKYDELYEEGSKRVGRYFSESKFKKSYHERFWRKAVFEGVDMIQQALIKSYGVNKVSLVSAAFRWLNHHSLLSPDHGGTSCGWTSEMYDKCVH
jgi:aflatoxin B1 aldehyde reductase